MTETETAALVCITVALLVLMILALLEGWDG